MPDRAGQQLGNYRLLRLLGRGSFAEVYLGEHVYLKRRAAVKVLHTSLDDEEVDRFLAEGQTLARLTHPHIVPVFDFAVQQGTPFLVMDYAPRGTLRQRHPRGSCLPLVTTVTYLKQVAAALHYAHTHQVIHRDVKPENILLGSGQQVLLSDFGLALFSSSPEQLATQEKAGTIPYMAPEQLRGKPGFASDQYALGIVVYEWLCGVRPFEGDRWQVAYQHTSVPPPPLRDKNPSLPEVVEAVVLKALAKDPKDRYANVQQFAQEFEKVSGVSPLDLRPEEEGEATVLLDQLPAAPTITPKGVFLSASSADEAFVARLSRDLQQRGIVVQQEDPDRTRNSSHEQDGVRQAIRSVEAVLVVLSPAARASRTVKEHLRIANLYQQRLIFIWAAGEEIASVLPDEWGRTVQIDLVDAREARYEGALDQVLACLQEGISQEISTLQEPAFEPRNPYKGLRAFAESDTRDFFGRDSLIEELVDRVRGMFTPTARLLAVIGASGSGKSSAVMAGLLPRLEQGVLPGSQQWIYPERMMPGSRPLEALTLTLAPHLPERSVKSIHEDLQDESTRGLHRLATQLVKAPGQRVVLFIDQFEELFTLTTSEEERGRFIDVLVTAMTEPQGPMIVLLTLRADFYDRPLAYPSLSRLIVGHQVVVEPMEVQDLRAVIKGPAALPDVQLAFEGNLVGDLLFEVQGQVGALPLLQFTLEQLFQRRNGSQLTLFAYREIGGVKGALARQAEETYAALPSEEHRRLSRALFVRLIDPGASEQDTTRRRAALSEFSLPEASQTRLLQEVADAFIAVRLLTTNEIAGTTTMEVSHEALIREWPRLSGWLREAREDIRLQQTISRDAAEWERRNKPGDRLYRGSQLSEARTWARRSTPNQNEQAFLSASLAQQRRSRLNMVAVVLLVVLTAGLLFQFLQSQFVPSTVVTNTLDAGQGSFRQVIDQAPPGSTITFRAGTKGIIMLTNGDLDIKQPLTIMGPGPGVLTISSGTHGYRVKIEPSAVVSISGLSFQNSKNLTSGFIYNGGNLSLTNSSVSGNSSGDLDSRKGFGGGISNFGVLTVSHSLILGNKATRQGGGISNFGLLTLTDTIVSGNSTTGDGGGIYTDNYGSLSLTNSTVSGNTAARDGGGIANGGFFNGGPLSLAKSTISGNTASGNGGGISNYGQLTLTNSTISTNRAAGNGSGIFDGGTKSQANLTFCTFYGNSATGQGGAIFQESPTPLTDTQLQACIVAGNHAAINAGITGILTSNGYNLLQSLADLTFTAPGPRDTDQSVEDTDLTRIFAVPVQLRRNGGSTETYALSPNLANPALDRVPLSLCQLDGMSTDQRAIKRPDGNEQFCDIGAYEAGA